MSFSYGNDIWQDDTYIYKKNVSYIIETQTIKGIKPQQQNFSVNLESLFFCCFLESLKYTRVEKTVPCHKL